MVWLVYCVKWLHLLFVLLLIGGLAVNATLVVVSCRAADLTKRQLLRGSQVIEHLGWIAMVALAVTGSILVYPRGYTYATPWIDAAYIFLALAMVCFWLGSRIKHRLFDGKAAVLPWLIAYSIVHIVLLVVLTVIAYEAVSKQTFLF